MKLRTKMYHHVAGSSIGYLDSSDADHDAACAHALMQELASMRSAADTHPRTHERQLVLNLLDALERQASENMGKLGFDSGEDA
mgnify:CR=1 FL=1